MTEGERPEKRDGEPVVDLGLAEDEEVHGHGDVADGAEIADQAARRGSDEADQRDRGQDAKREDE